MTPTVAPLPTLKIVRLPDGTSHLVAIACANLWVLRRPWLTPEDVD